MKEYKVKVYNNRTEWYNLEGQLHREDGPASENANGDKSYYLNGKRHREDGPAVEWPNGYKYYYINDKLHREDGPAVECSNGDKYYFINGKRHREDGPAIEYSNGYKAYYINDKKLTEEEFNNRNNPTLDKAAEYYAHNYFDMHETNSYKELKKGFIAGVEWERKTNKV